MRWLLFGLAILGAPMQANAQEQAGATPAPTIVRFTTEGQARVRPDRATISAGVVASAETAAAALAQSSEKIEAVLATLKRAKVDPRDIQTSNLSLIPQFNYNEGSAPKLTGYQAQSTLDVTVQDLKMLGKLIDAVVDSGANQLNAVNFTAKDPSQAVDRAREEAVVLARKRAELYAKALGQQVTRITMLEEIPGGVFPVAAPTARLVSNAKIDVPIEPGEIAYSVSLTVTFELR